MSTDDHDQKKIDWPLLRAIARGPGNYPTPAQNRVDRLTQQGLVKKVRATLRPTIKGRLMLWFKR